MSNLRHGIMTLKRWWTDGHDEGLWKWVLYREDGIRFSSFCSVAFYEMNIFRCYNRRNR
jgi:hypothetical protein